MKYDQTPFALAPASFARAMPNPVVVSDDDLAKIELPGWRYDQIMEAVLSMYDKVDAHLMPLPVFDIANGLEYSIVPYRAYGSRLHEVLLKTSEDALTLQFRGSSRPVILYNDRRPPKRINYSILHEIAHNELGHQEHCPLAEKEANYFAGLALCPVDLLDHYGIRDVQKIAQLFNVSDEFSSNRLKTLHNRRRATFSEVARRFRRNVITRFHFKKAFQMDLFAATTKTSE